MEAEASLENIVSAICAVKTERCIGHKELMQAVEKLLIERALLAHDHIQEVTGFLQMDRKYVYRKRKEYGIKIQIREGNKWDESSKIMHGS